MSTVTIKWVSVKDEYPEEDRTVLLSIEGSAYALPGYSDGKEFYLSCDHFPVINRVTHWAELPMGPNP